MRLPRKLLLTVIVAVAMAAPVASTADGAVLRQTKESLTPPGFGAVGYLLSLPEDYTTQPAETWPLLIFLHGSGESGTNLDLVAVHGPPKMIEQGWDFPAIVVSPQCSGSWWNSAQLEAFFAQLAVRYRVDPDRILVTGLSMGGYATWDLAVRHPENYGAVIPICGAGTPSLANRLVDLPLWAFHGALDPTVAPAGSQSMIDGIRAAGGEPLFTLYPNLGHDSWSVTYRNPEVYAWLFAQSRLRLPAILTPPVALSRTAGQSATLAVTATGRALDYQWRRNGLNLPGATAAALTIPSLSAEDAGEYAVVVTNDRGRVISPAVALDVRSAPVIFAGPITRIAAAGSGVGFHVDAGGGELAFQWRHNGNDVPGATAPALQLSHASLADAGIYSVLVSNPRGSIESSPAALAFATPVDTGRLVNLSIRGVTAAGERTLIAGFHVGGGRAGVGTPFLLRGAGPSLAAHNVSGFLTDPALLLFDSGKVDAANADWSGRASIAAAAQQTGAFAFIAETSLDAALLATLTSGGHTVHVTCNDPAGSGIVLAECYDAADSFTADSPRLINVSGRGFVDAGENILIAGFSIAGTTPVRVLIRAIGPALSEHDVANVLPDPRLRLFQGQTMLAENDDWAGDASLEAVFAAVNAFPLPPDSKDAALVISLPAGNYTAQATGGANAGGVALVEVFAVPLP